MKQLISTVIVVGFLTACASGSSGYRKKKKKKKCDCPSWTHNIKKGEKNNHLAKIKSKPNYSITFAI